MIESTELEGAGDPRHSAKVVGLRYVSDAQPGIQRIKAGKTFRYLDDKGKPVCEEAVLRRIKSLVVPPAWKDVWICPQDNGHLQATGRDVRGRKQHRYHRKWREVRDENKYARMVSFAKSLGKIRRATRRDMAGHGLTREKVLATVVRLLEVSLIRVGNEEYARENQSFGLTTMRDRHVNVAGSKVWFRFRGKSGKEHEVAVEDKRLAGIVKRCRDIPGHELFQYFDENNQRQKIDSADVNDYLRQVTGEEFTAKDFRTWAGTVLAAIALRGFKEANSAQQKKRNVVQAVEAVAKKLGNTPAICRKCYIHPAIVNSYLDGSLVKLLEERAEAALRNSDFGPMEKVVLKFLQSQLSARKTPLESLLKQSLKRQKRIRRRVG